MENRRGPLSRGGFFRELLREKLERSNGGPALQGSGVLNYEESLAILTKMARDGRVAAAIHLVKVLGEAERQESGESHDWFDELSQRRGGPPRSHDLQSTR
jgi:hypothetical protein